VAAVDAAVTGAGVKELLAEVISRPSDVDVTSGPCQAR